MGTTNDTGVHVFSNSNGDLNINCIRVTADVSRENVSKKTSGMCQTERQEDLELTDVWPPPPQPTDEDGRVNEVLKELRAAI